MTKIDETKTFCLKKAETYEGKLGTQLLIQMMLSIEKKAKEYCKSDSSFNKDAFLVGIYFHDLGRIISDGSDHPEKGYELFQESFENKFDEEDIKIIKDCCLNHGSDANPETKEGKLLQIWDKSIVFEPEVMMVVLKKLMLKNNDWDIAYAEFIKKMNKWHGKISDDLVKQEHLDTLNYLNNV
jgi:hypothetical protein